MNIIGKSTAAAIGMTIALISLGLIHPTTVIGKENRPHEARIQNHGRTSKGSKVSPAGAGLRSAASGTRESRRGPNSIREHRAAGVFDDPFFFDVGAVRSNTRRTKR